MRVLLISGSLRDGSTNTAALKTARATAPSTCEAHLFAGMGQLPHFDPDVESSGPPASVQELRAMLAAADGVLLSTPEYAGCLPGSFKNLLDWTVGEGLYGKPVGWINASAHGGATATYETLRRVLTYVNAEIVESACRRIPIRRDAIGPDGLVSDPKTREAIAETVAALAKHLAASAPH